MNRTKAIERWNKMIAIVEAAGYISARNGDKTYESRDRWEGCGSSYVYLNCEDSHDTICIRMSDHGQVNGGGLRFKASLDDFDRSGEADISIAPGSGVTLRNFAKVLAAKIEAVKWTNCEV